MGKVSPSCRKHPGSFKPKMTSWAQASWFWLRKRRSCIGLSPTTRCWCPSNTTWYLCYHGVVCPHRSWTVVQSLPSNQLCLTRQCCSCGALTWNMRWDTSILRAPGSASYLSAPLLCLPASREWVVSGVPVKLTVTDIYCWHPGIPCHWQLEGPV